MSVLSAKPQTERAQHVLKILVERYIRDGLPVGSKTLAEGTALGLSSASIRTVLADLEAHGYLRSPHTSAGRVPTVKGYRFFVDSLLTLQRAELDKVAYQQVQQHFAAEQNVAALVSSTSNLLSGVTQMAGLVMLPKRERAVLRHVEFLPLSDNRVLVIFVLNEHEVQNQIIQTDRTYAASELQEAAAYLVSHYAEQEITAIQQQLLATLQHDQAELTRRQQVAALFVNEALLPSTSPSQDYLIAGQHNLLSARDETRGAHVRQLFEAFAQKQTILQLLEQCLQAEAMQIFIGTESGYAALNECSLVSAPYSFEGKPIGVLGVIGPTRMSYERIIPIVDVTAKLLTAALNQNY